MNQDSAPVLDDMFSDPTASGRPLVGNDDGTFSTERSITVTDQRINNGLPTNIPSMFNGQQVPEDEAINKIVQAGGVDPENGRQLEGFKTIDEAVSAAKARSHSLDQTADMFSDPLTTVPAETIPSTQGRGSSAYGSFMQGFGHVISSVPKAISEGAVAIANQFGDNPVLGNPEGKTPEDTALYSLGESIDQWIEHNFPTNSEYQGEFNQDLASGAGSMFGFLGGGLTGRLAKMPSWLIAGGLGASAEGVGLVDEYKDFQAQKGEAVDPGTRAKLMASGIPLGAMEALPIQSLLNRIDRVSGGGVKKIVAEGFKGGLEELAQEVMQQFGGNLAAQQLYNPEQDLTEGVQRGGEVGWTLGFLLNSLGAALGMKLNKGKRDPNDSQSAADQPMGNDSLSDPLAAEDVIGTPEPAINESVQYDGGIDFEAPEMTPVEPAPDLELEPMDQQGQPANPIYKYEGGIDFEDPMQSVTVGPAAPPGPPSISAGLETDVEEGRRFMQSRLPENLFDPRLAREDFRVKVQQMADSLIKGGDIGYIEDEHGKITGRTSSINPDWYQSLASNPETKVTVEQAQTAINKAMNAKKLGIREARVVTAFLDEVQGERTSPEHLDYAREQLDKARELRRTYGFSRFTHEDNWEYDEQDYHPAMDAEGRTFYDLLEQARSMGDDIADQAEAILERQTTDDAAFRSLANLLTGQTDEQPTQTIATPAGGTESARPGPAGVQTETAGRQEAEVTPEVTPAPQGQDVDLSETEPPKPSGSKVKTESDKKPAQAGFSLEEEPLRSGDTEKQRTLRSKMKGKRTAEPTQDTQPAKPETKDERKKGSQGEAPAQQSAQLSDLPDSLISEFPDFPLTAQGLIPIRNLKSDEVDSARKAGVVITSKTEEGSEYEAIDPDILWEERKKRQSSQKIKRTTSEQHIKGADRRAANYDRLAQEQENLGELGDAVLAVTYRDKANKIRQEARQRVKESESKKPKPVDEAAHEAATSPNNDHPEPSQAQKKAGNYKLGHIRLHGLDISIENPKGSERSGTDKGGKKWSIKMANHYGYIKKTEGKDGDHVDVFLSDQAENADLPVFVVDQVNPESRRFDEHKVMMGFENEAAARKAYLANYEKGWQGIGGVKEYTLEAFKDWIHNGDTKKRVAEPDKQRAIKKKSRKTLTYKIVPAGNKGFSIKGANHESVVLSRKPRGPSILDPVPAKQFKTENEARLYLKSHGMVEAEVEQAKPKKPATYGSTNAIFTQDAADKARELLKKKLGQVSAGLDPEMMQAGITLAGYHIEAGARKFSDFSKAMIADLGDAVKPYLRAWYEGVRHWPDFDNKGLSTTKEIELYSKQETNNVSSTGDNLESDSTTGQEPGSEDAVRDAGRGTGKDAGTSSQSTESRQGGQQGDRRVSDDSPADVGESGNFDLFSQDGQFRSEEGPAGRTDTGRSDTTDDAGVQTEPETSLHIEPYATESEHQAKLDRQRKAERIKNIHQDIDNIRETLPFLTPEQQDDVLKTEKRFYEANGKGMMFTNGTGTGKTYTGLGIAKRFAKDGKNNILIVTPSEAKVTDWAIDAKNLFIKAEPLPNVVSAGEGAVVTTYANFRQNKALLERHWDLILYDESHKLMENMQGKKSDTTEQHYTITNHRDFEYKVRGRNELRDEYAKYQTKVKKEAERLEEIEKLNGFAAEDKARKKYKEEYKLLEKQADKLADKYRKWEEESPTKVVFLSATPWAGHKNVFYADGYVFDTTEGYDESSTSHYNAGDNFDQFLVSNFGYHMRYNRAERPEAGIDVGLLERNFNQQLVEAGSLSGRAIEVEQDYAREFVLVDPDIGTEIDRGMYDVIDHKSYPKLSEHLRQKTKGIYKHRLLETIKAKASIERIEKHLALGRKVVVFHNYIEGAPAHPFRFVGNGEEELEQEITHFKNHHSDLVNLDLSGLRPVVDTLLKHFGEKVAVFNGRQSKKDRRAAIKDFNNDNNELSILVVQKMAGKEGISLHDITGKRQRVVMVLGLPTSPTDAIQMEGRVYRIGVQSDAIFEYPVINTSFERFAYADTISQRVSTAENLAMGLTARDMDIAFKEGYLNPVEESPKEGQGKGGKEGDRNQREISDFDRAKTYYLARGKKTSRNKSAEGKDYFATPEPLGLKMVEWSNIKPNEDAMEPSGGHGAIARFFPGHSNNTAIEPSGRLASELAVVTNGKVIRDTFENHHLINKYDVIAMNPPFGKGGSDAIRHIEKAIKHLKNGGRITAIIPRGGMADKRFDKLMYDNKLTENIYLAADITLPTATFERAATKVATRVVVLDRQDNPEDAPQSANYDFSSFESVHEFFDEIEDFSIDPRNEPTKTKEEREAEEAEAKAQEEAKRTGLEMTEGEHTRDHYPIWTIKMVDRVPRDRYMELKSLAKKHDGYYSRYATGFIFKEKENAEAFMVEALPSDESVSFSLGDKVRTPWPENYPNAVILKTAKEAQGHPDYRAAKDGDIEAAYRLARDLIEDEDINKLSGAIGDNYPIVVAIHAEERVSVNQIPLAYAEVIGNELGLEVDESIVQTEKIGRGGSDGFYRLANQPTFTGEVEKGRKYLIVDDTLTQGGTLASLRGYIESQGGEVILTSALMGKQYSSKLAPSQEILQKLRERYGNEFEQWFVSEFGYGFDSLTESEARYLDRVKVPETESVRDRLLAAKQARQSAASEGTEGSGPPVSAKLSNTETRPQTGFSVSGVQEIVDRLTSSWKNKPKITVLSSIEDVPDKFKNQIKGKENRIKGFVDNQTGEVYLVAGNLLNDADVERAIFHEVLLHAGFKGFGDQAVTILKQVYLAVGRSSLVDIAKRYNFDLDKESDRLKAVEEYLAKLAESYHANTLSKKAKQLFDRIVSMIRDLMRQLGFNLKLTKADMGVILQDAANHIRKETAVAGETVSEGVSYSVNAPIFYSQLQSVLAKKLPNSGPAKQLAMTVQSWAKKGEFKQEELEWSGLVEWLQEQEGKVSKDQVLDYLRVNNIQIEEMEKISGKYKELEELNKYRREMEIKYGTTQTYEWPKAAIEKLQKLQEAAHRPSSVAKFAGYQLPGGKNYREMLLTLPVKKLSEDASAKQFYENFMRKGGEPSWDDLSESEKLDIKDQVPEVALSAPDGESYKSSHFDEPNVLAHIRFNERTDAEGKRVLFVEEVQSDWHQEGRKKGYKKDVPSDSEVRQFFELDSTVTDIESYRQEMMEHSDYTKNTVPDAPFKTTWPLLAMKRMIRYAAENGFDRIAWTTGEQQADRYDLSKQIDSVEYNSGTETLYAYKDHDRVISKSDVKEEDLPDLIGKEAADKLIKNKRWDNKNGGSSYHLEGEQLKVGGEGMKGFYDKILPSAVNKYVKKWGAKVGKTNIGKRKYLKGLFAMGNNRGEWHVVDMDENILDTFASEEEADAFVNKNENQLDPLVTHSIDISKKMRDAVLEQGQVMFSLGDPISKDHRDDLPDNQKKLLDRLGKGQPIDRVFRKAFDIAGVPDKTKKGYNQLEKLVMDRKFNTDGYMGWMNPFLEHLRAGLIDRYGLTEEYKQRDFEREAEKRRIQMEGADFINTMMNRGMDVKEAKVFKAILEGEQIPDSEWNDIAAPVRQALDQLGHELVELGWLDAETYERHRGTWLHRAYKKHEIEQTGLGRWVNNQLSNRRAKMIGSQLRQRGMNMNIEQDKLLDAVPVDWWGRQKFKNKTDGSLQGMKFIVLDKVQAVGQGTETFEGMGEPGRKPRVLDRRYWPADVPLPNMYKGWDNKGIWEARGYKGNKITLWRDFTQSERESMGEILDARYVLAKSYMLLANDVSTARFYSDIAKNPNWVWSEEGPPDSGTITTPKGAMATYVGYEWVQIPESTLPGTTKRLWGPLAGKYVRAEIWRDLNELRRLQVPGLWRKLLTQWKLNKTARNPVVHMNNIMSNFIFMDMADIRWQDLYRGWYALRHETKDYRDAVEHGVFGSNFVDQEVRRQILDPLLEELKSQNLDEASGAEGRLNNLSQMYESIWKWVGKADKRMIDWYSMEDEIFRMATYMRRLSLGDQPDVSARAAREQFLNYDIRAPWVNAMRGTVLPFIAYTYRAVPVIAKSIAERPWKLAKYTTIAYMVNALGYMLSPGDEDEERRSMREQAQGNTWLPGVPRMMRMPWHDEHGNPVFLDIRRWIPAGDVFDMNQGQWALPIPAPLQLSGPLMLAGELALNKQAFTGKEIVDSKIDTTGESAAKLGGWAWRSWMPAAPWIPESWYWQKIERSIKGGRDMLGREYGIGYAFLSSAGVKLAPHDVKYGLSWHARDIDQIQRALSSQMFQLESDKKRNLIDGQEYLKQKQVIKRKMENLREHAKKVLGQE